MPVDTQPLFSISDVRGLLRASQSVIDHAPASAGNLSSHIWELSKAVSLMNEIIKREG